MEQFVEERVNPVGKLGLIVQAVIVPDEIVGVIVEIAALALKKYLLKI